MSSFLIDTQLPPKLADFFKQNAIDAIHTTHFPQGHLLKDNDIIDFAIRERRIIVTKDKDFLDYYLLNGAPPKI